MTRITRPVLRYQGGKWRVADWILGHLPPHHCYVEPFGGAASVLMKKPPSAIEVYNDLDASVVNLFRILRDPMMAHQLRRLVELTPYSRFEFEQAWEPATDPIEEARRLIVRTAQSIGAKQRASRNGWRAGPTHGSAATIWTGWPSQIPRYVDRLRQVLIEQRPALDVLAQYDSPATLFYVDPPYMLRTRAWDHRRIYANELTDDDHAALLARLQELRGMVMLSGYASELYADTLGGWKRFDVHARAQANRARIESLWINPAGVAAMRQAHLHLEETP